MIPECKEEIIESSNNNNSNSNAHSALLYHSLACSLPVNSRVVMIPSYLACVMFAICLHSNLFSSLSVVLTVADDDVGIDV